jgi:broad specificity phosphatase PhoE
VTLVYLARHGETQDNAEGRVQGWLDPPLNDRGRRQAVTLARETAGLGIAALYTSQLRRAHETAAIVGEAIGLEPRVDERLAESKRGAWEGRLLGELEREDPARWAAWRAGGAAFRFPGGESIGEHAARVEAALADILAGPVPALAVSHGGTIRCALAARRPEGLAAFNEIAVPNGVLVPLP